MFHTDSCESLMHVLRAQDDEIGASDFSVASLPSCLQLQDLAVEKTARSMLLTMHHFSTTWNGGGEAGTKHQCSSGAAVHAEHQIMRIPPSTGGLLWKEPKRSSSSNPSRICSSEELASELYSGASSAFLCDIQFRTVADVLVFAFRRKFETRHCAHCVQHMHYCRVPGRYDQTISMY